MDEKLKIAMQCGFLGSLIGSIIVATIDQKIIDKQKDEINKMAQDFKAVQNALTILLEEGSFEGSTIMKVHDAMEFRLMTRDL